MFRIPAAACLIVCAGAAQAQSTTSVTLYGIADIGIFHERIKSEGDTESTTGLLSGGQSGSRWGLRGSEDLGGGLKANFQLESGFNLNNGTLGQNGRLFGRAAWGGLSGGFGELRFGRQATMSSTWFGEVSPFGTSWSNAAIGKSGFRASDTPRFDNVVTYLSPKFANLQVAGGYSFNTRGGVESSDRRTTAWNLAARYASGPLYVAATYDRLNTSDLDTNANGRDPSAIQLGATYDFKVVQVGLGWSQQKDGWVKSAEGASSSPNNNLGESAYFDGKVNAYLVGVTVPLGSTSLLASYSHVSPDSSAFPGGDSVNVYNLGVNYALSKRTSLYALASLQDGDLYGFAPDSRTTQFGVGLQHKF
ncbi:porin [Verticiella sediminum]|uniref:Porin n=1 Tax=Verticiella sediminum TaxID=1247510 RepID=A0A556A7Z8_9BURK|nr:porin [Verticiella sediminum]TSH88993.1 porin [Verticiella sediminum]